MVKTLEGTSTGYPVTSHFSQLAITSPGMPPALVMVSTGLGYLHSLDIFTDPGDLQFDPSYRIDANPGCLRSRLAYASSLFGLFPEKQNWLINALKLLALTGPTDFGDAFFGVPECNHVSIRIPNP